MLYLFDANVLITASNTYYPIDQIPEFWSWVQYQGKLGNIKIPVEILEEILAGRKKDDPLLDWIGDKENRYALELDDTVDAAVVQEVVNKGYAPDLTDVELLVVGRDPFIIAYCMGSTDDVWSQRRRRRPARSGKTARFPTCAIRWALIAAIRFTSIASLASRRRGSRNGQG